VTVAARGHVQVIAGCMFSGKTDELLRLLRRAEIARRRILLVRPVIDDRTEREVVRSRSGAAFQSKAVADPYEIETLAKDAWADLIAIEEAQFFAEGLVGVVERLAGAGRTVVCCGLNLDFRGRPFGPMPLLLAIADGVTSLSAICTVCGEEATRTQRLIDGRPAGADEPVVVVGGLAADTPSTQRETYEARCRAHHELP
jgi:thymidine kinase